MSDKPRIPDDAFGEVTWTPGKPAWLEWNDAHYVFPPEGGQVLAFWEDDGSFEVVRCWGLQPSTCRAEWRSGDGKYWRDPTLWAFIPVPVVLHDLTDPQM